MLNVAVKMQEAWRNDPTVKANYYEEQARDLTKAILPAFWKHRPESIIIDKGRGWAKNMPTASALFGKKIKAIVMTRDLPSIMASWLTIIRNQPGCFVDKNLLLTGHLVTDENRVGEMWFNMVKDCMEGLHQIKREAADQIVIVEYDKFIETPMVELDRIADFLQLPSFEYDVNTIENDTADDDLIAWGFEGLHTIRPVLGKTSKHPREVLGDMLYYRFVELEKQYIL